MRLCTRCGEEREDSDFRLRNGKIMTPCKKCYLEYGRRHYRNNKQYYLDKARNRSAAYWEVVHRLFWEYLREHPCVDCDTSDPRILEFDHVRGEKNYNIADMKRLRFSWARILTEIEKCEVRCANCHRIKTYEQFQWPTFDTAP